MVGCCGSGWMAWLSPAESEAHKAQSQHSTPAHVPTHHVSASVMAVASECTIYKRIALVIVLFVVAVFVLARTWWVGTCAGVLCCDCVVA